MCELVFLVFSAQNNWNTQNKDGKTDGTKEDEHESANKSMSLEEREGE